MLDYFAERNLLKHLILKFCIFFMFAVKMFIDNINIQ